MIHETASSFSSDARCAHGVRADQYHIDAVVRVDPREPEALQKAVHDPVCDLTRVLGKLMWLEDRCLGRGPCGLGRLGSHVPPSVDEGTLHEYLRARLILGVPAWPDAGEAAVVRVAPAASGSEFSLWNRVFLRDASLS